VSRRMLFDRGSAGVALGSCRRTKSQESWGAAVRMEGRETEPMRDSVSSEIQNGPIRLAGWLSSPPRIALAAPVAALFLAFAAGLAPAQASAATPAYPGLTGGSAVSTTTGTATAIGSDFDITDATSVGWSSVTATVTTDTGTLTADAGDSGATVSVASNTITIEGSTAQSVRSCATLPKGVFVVERNGGTVSGRTICWTRSSLGVGKSVTYQAVVRSSKTRSGRVSVSGRASATNSSGATARATASESVRIVRPRAPRPKPVTG
jgi:hypothetical protein